MPHPTITGTSPSIINKGEHELTEEQRIQDCEYFLQLGNLDEYFRLEPLNFENFTPDNIVDRLNFIQKVSHTETLDEENIQRMIQYACEHFSEIPTEKVKKLEISMIEELIKNKNLRIENEDSLLQLILDLYEENYSCSYLFEHVNFINLSQNAFSEFIDRFNIDHLNSPTFRKICNSILLQKEGKNCQERYKSDKVFEASYNEGDKFNGIMKYLSKKTNGNIHDNGTIEITSNFIRVSKNNACHPKNLVDYENDSYYHSSGSPQTYVCFDFKDKEIQLSSYSIKTNPNESNNYHLKNWNIEVSNDGNNWSAIDEHSNDSTLNGPSRVANFHVQQKSDNFYRYVRLLQTGCNWNDNDKYHYLHFNLIEFFGKIKMNK